MADQLYRFTFEHFGVRGEVVVLAASWRAVLERHHYPRSVGDYLGEALAAAVLLSGTIKFKGSLILQIQGSGPLRTLVAQATDQRMLRGMALADGEVPPADLSGAFGDARLVLSAESPKGERYQGVVGLEGRRLADVIESYFSQSEQLPTRVWLAADAESAAGLFLQRLPGDADEDQDGWNRVCLLADTLDSDELLHLAPEALLRRLFHEEALRLYTPEPVAFRCGCSRERIAGVLRGLGAEEVNAIIEDRGVVEVDCEFCNTHYRFDAVDAAALFADGTVADPSDAHH